MVREILLFGAFSDEKGGSYMGQVRIDPRKQFSKKLARWTAVFWFLFMAWLSVLLLLAPASSLYAVYMGVIATAVMILNVWAYTRNSIYEKGVFAMLDKAKIEMNLKTGASAGDDGAEEEGDNG